MSETGDSDILMNGEEWFAKNWRLLLNAALVILVSVAVYNWMISSGAESASAAEKDLHGAISSNATNLIQMALELNGVHMKYPDNSVGERALILSANIALQEGEYDTAKNRFESYLSKYKSDGNWFEEALLGQAICKETEGDTADAIKKYQNLTNSTVASIRQRTSSLLEAAKVELAGLPSRPIPAKVELDSDNASKGENQKNNNIKLPAPPSVDQK